MMKQLVSNKGIFTNTDKFLKGALYFKDHVPLVYARGGGV